MSKVYFVRHGEYTEGPERLTARGAQQSEHAGKALQDLGIGLAPLILSSSAPRAFQTADIIRTTVDTTREVIASDYLKKVGLSGVAPSSITELLQKASDNIEIILEEDVIVVLHEPLLITISQQPHVKHCEIIARSI